jgi:UDP-3-O-[3-hydroxymyristoyl] glucosamine N-acyltransferase
MNNELKSPMLASELADLLGARLTGNDCPIERVLTLDRASDGSLAFAKSAFAAPRDDQAVVIAPPGTPVSTGAVIESSHPRLTFAKALARLAARPGFVCDNTPAKVHPEAVVSTTAMLGNGVCIGRGTSVGHFVVIADGVQIGEDCIIKSGAVIGEPGFGFERDIDGTPLRLVHLGKVVIGNRVEIGSNATVCRGTLDETVVEDDAKIDDQVHVSHNCRIRRGAMIVACAELCGSVEIGEYAWIGPNASVLQKMKVGEGALVGLGANVLRTVAAGDTIAGYPGRSLGKRSGE